MSGLSDSEHNPVYEARMKLGMTQAEFAEHIGISENYVWQLEKGRRILSDKIKRKLENLQDVSNSKAYPHAKHDKEPDRVHELMAPYMDKAEKVIRLERELLEARQLISMQARTIVDQAAAINRITSDDNKNGSNM